MNPKILLWCDWSLLKKFKNGQSEGLRTAGRSHMNTCQGRPKARPSGDLLGNHAKKPLLTDQDQNKTTQGVNEHNKFWKYFTAH